MTVLTDFVKAAAYLAFGLFWIFLPMLALYFVLGLIG
jgi:hypothetical protein